MIARNDYTYNNEEIGLGASTSGAMKSIFESVGTDLKQMIKPLSKTFANELRPVMRKELKRYMPTLIGSAAGIFLLGIIVSSITTNYWIKRGC